MKRSIETYAKGTNDATSITKYGPPTQLHAQMVALRLHCARTTLKAPPMYHPMYPLESQNQTQKICGFWLRTPCCLVATPQNCMDFSYAFLLSRGHTPKTIQIMAIYRSPYKTPENGSLTPPAPLASSNSNPHPTPQRGPKTTTKVRKTPTRYSPKQGCEGL